MTLFITSYANTLDLMVYCKYKDLPDPIEIPSCKPLHGCAQWEVDPTGRSTGDRVTSTATHQSESISSLQKGEEGRKCDRRRRYEDDVGFGQRLLLTLRKKWERRCEDMMPSSSNGKI
uniref:Uncharacterized protein n=1 Tax=Tanacetum cinerariifolium TaxID=118510 RepID=A0A6L2L9P1_TANCI|nr:hypothetical protein [Tanacetum cinerariifolium]